MTTHEFNVGDEVFLIGAKGISGEVISVYTEIDGASMAKVHWSTNDYAVSEYQSLLESCYVEKESELHFMQPAVDLIEKQIQDYVLSITTIQEKIEDLIRIKNDLLEL